MIILYKVDVKKSRKECEAFVAAEERRAAFGASHSEADDPDRNSFSIATRTFKRKDDSV